MQSNTCSVKIRKGVTCLVKFKIYQDAIRRVPVDLNKYNEFICAITENGRLLIEKRYTKNAIVPYSDMEKIPPYILAVNFDKEDTENLSLNPQGEERQRTIEIFGLSANDEVICFIATNFYLEGSGYYVRRDRA